MKEVDRGIELTPVIQIGYEAKYYEVQIVLEVSILASGISAVLGMPVKICQIQFFPCNSIVSAPNENGSTASLYQFRHDYSATATDKYRYAELGVTTLQRCSGSYTIKLCRKVFSTTTNVTLFCLTYLF